MLCLLAIDREFAVLPAIISVSENVIGFIFSFTIFIYYAPFANFNRRPVAALFLFAIFLCALWVISFLIGITFCISFKVHRDFTQEEPLMMQLSNRCGCHRFSVFPFSGRSQSYLTNYASIQ
jgi:hypothetical protein